ncbi:MAG TPA: tetratricopeptide repeat protein [Burkholderiaceae bacterium]|jgi:tetratricopeptide (TPR) repeat protein
MNKKAGHSPMPVRQIRQPLSAETMNRMVALYNTAQWPQLEALAQQTVKQHPEHLFGWKALGKCRLQLGKSVEAIEALERAAKIMPGDADTQNDLAITFFNLGRREESIAAYRRLLKLTPGSAAAHDTLGAQLSDLGRFAEAEAEFRRALEVDPNYFQARINLGFVAGALERWNEAEAWYLQVLQAHPDFGEAHRRLGDLLSRLPGRGAEAIPFLERAIALNPADAGSIVTLGNVLMAEKRTEESRALFLRAQQIQPLITWPSKLAKPAFSLLLLDAPGAGSTPLNYLAGHAAYDCHFVGIMAGLKHDLTLLRGKADLVFNMIADADNGKEVLPLALELADQFACPVVNHPRKILQTDRASIARTLADIPLCRVPKTRRFPAAELAGAAGLQALSEFGAPFLIRCAGTHGGDDFEKIDDPAAVDDFVKRNPDATIYVSDFVDYRAPDGYYRKYRLIFLDDQILPYHLAIHDHWMVHHFRTDMANQEWMRKEEQAFLEHPQSVFSEAHYESLRKASAAIGLDYCGIDCSLDQHGNIVVFEANATMLVHDEKNPTFAYKNPYIAKIKQAFDHMLTVKAGGQR